MFDVQLLSSPDFPHIYWLLKKYSLNFSALSDQHKGEFHIGRGLLISFTMIHNLVEGDAETQGDVDLLSGFFQEQPPPKPPPREQKTRKSGASQRRATTATTTNVLGQQHQQLKDVAGSILARYKQPGFADRDFAERALLNLARKLAASSNCDPKACLERLEKILASGEKESTDSCACIARPRDGRMTVAKSSAASTKKVFPQVVLCQVRQQSSRSPWTTSLMSIFQIYM